MKNCLHIVNKPLPQEHWQVVLNAMGDQDSLLLIEDAVYLIAQSTSPVSEELAYFLQTDAQSRGVMLPSPSYQALRNHRAMVELVLQHQTNLTWTF